jgi:hypothetical protein
MKIYVFHFIDFFKLLCWVGVHCGIYRSSYKISNIAYLNSPPLPLSFIPSLPPYLEQFQQVSFYITYMCTQFLHRIHPPTPFPTGTNTSLWFCRRKWKKKKMTFLLVWDKGSYTGSFLMLFPCINLYCNPNWFISSIFLYFTLVPFLWWFQLV